MSDHQLRTDVLIAAAIALAVLIITPGVVVAAAVGLAALGLLALIAAAERRRSRARRRSRRTARLPARPVEARPFERASGSGGRPVARESRRRSRV
jgi:hypothetical protein